MPFSKLFEIFEAKKMRKNQTREVITLSLEQRARLRALVSVQEKKRWSLQTCEPARFSCDFLRLLNVFSFSFTHDFIFRPWTT